MPVFALNVQPYLKPRKHQPHQLILPLSKLPILLLLLLTSVAAAAASYDLVTRQPAQPSSPGQLPPSPGLPAGPCPPGVTSLPAGQDQAGRGCFLKLQSPKVYM